MKKSESEQLKKVYDCFDDDALRMIIFAKSATIVAGVEYMEPLSFIIGILMQGDDITADLRSYNVDVDKCLKKLKAMLKGKSTGKNINLMNLKISKEINDVCLSVYAFVPDDMKVKAVHFFVAIMNNYEDIKKVFIKNSPKGEFEKYLDDLRSSF